MGVREIRRRVRGIKSTLQVTRALELVAGVKLRIAQERVQSFRPYAEGLRALIQDLGESQTLFQEKGPRCLVLITSDMGLAGGYNAALHQGLGSFDSWDGHLVVGRKGRDMLKKREAPIWGEFLGLEDASDREVALRIAKQIRELLSQREAQVYLLYNQFQSKIEQHPVLMRLIPPDSPAKATKDPPYIFEPTGSILLDRLLTSYLEASVHLALLEAKASEHASRMRAMDAATSNGEDLLDDLALELNRIRQGQITAEIAEILGGVEG